MTDYNLLTKFSAYHSLPNRRISDFRITTFSILAPFFLTILPVMCLLMFYSALVLWSPWPCFCDKSVSLLLTLSVFWNESVTIVIAYSYNCFVLPVSFVKRSLMFSVQFYLAVVTCSRIIFWAKHHKITPIRSHQAHHKIKNQSVSLVTQSFVLI